MLARPHLQALVEATGETATLSVPGERDAITVDFVQSPRRCRSVAQLGRPSVGHATAAGKVVLAFGGRSLAGGELLRFTELTVVDRRPSTRELAQIRADGLRRAVDEREVGSGRALPRPCSDAAAELVAILGVQGPSERFRGGVLDAAALPLLAAAASLSRTLRGVEASRPRARRGRSRARGSGVPPCGRRGRAPGSCRARARADRARAPRPAR